MTEYYKKHSASEPFHQIDNASEDSWVHLGAPSGDELRDVIESYGLDEAIVHDVLDKNELARTEYSKGVQYVFLRPAMRTRSGEVKTRPFLAILHPKVFITIATSLAVTANDIAHTGDKSKISTAKRAGMTLATIGTIVGGYEQLIQNTDEYISSIRKKLRSHEVGNRDFVHFVTIEDNLNEYQTCLRDTLTVIERLKDNTHGLFTAREVEAIEDMTLYVRQLLSAVSSLMQTINSIRNAYSTIANNTLNQRMKLLTALTVLIALPNVFYGMYGMNVPLPFQQEGWAYPVIVIFTFIVILLVYTVARRFKVF
jgi:magnesium transporter